VTRPAVGVPATPISASDPSGSQFIADFNSLPRSLIAFRCGAISVVASARDFGGIRFRTPYRDCWVSWPHFGAPRSVQDIDTVGNPQSPACQKN
jgi:hypothetical protein